MFCFFQHCNFFCQKESLRTYSLTYLFIYLLISRVFPSMERIFREWRFHQKVTIKLQVLYQSGSILTKMLEKMDFFDFTDNFYSNQIAVFQYRVKFLSKKLICFCESINHFFAKLKVEVLELFKYSYLAVLKSAWNFWKQEHDFDSF